MQYYSGRVVKPDQTKLGSTKPNKSWKFGLQEWADDWSQHTRHHIIKLYGQASCQERLFILSKSLRWGFLVRRWCRMKEKTTCLSPDCPLQCCILLKACRGVAWFWWRERQCYTIRCGRASGSVFDQQGWGAVGTVIGGGAEGAGETKRVRWSWGSRSEGGEE